MRLQECSRYRKVRARSISSVSINATFVKDGDPFDEGVRLEEKREGLSNTSRSSKNDGVGHDEQTRFGSRV